MSLPKRFADRVEIADVRAEAEPLEPGAETNETRRLAGRVMARRDMGKTLFLDLVDRSGRIQLIVRKEALADLDLDLGDVVGVEGRPSKSRRGEPSVTVESLELLAKIRRPLPDTFHGLTDVETRYRQRYLDLLMNEQTRARLPAARADGDRDAPLSGRARLRRGRDADPPAALRRRVRRPVRDALQRRGPRLLPPDRDRALSQAADRRRAREGLRARARTSATRASPSSTRPSSRCSSGTRPTPTTATRWRGSRTSSARSRRTSSARRRSPSAATRSTSQPPWRRVRFVDALDGARPLDPRRGRAARASSTRAASTRRPTTDWPQLVDHAFTPLSSSRRWSSRRSSTTTRSRSRPSRAARTTTRSSSSASSSSSAGWSSATRSAS